MIRKLRALFGRAAVMSAADADQAVANGAVLLDVREDKEWRAGHAPQARHLALSQLEKQLATLPTDRQIVAVCRSGHRSAIAANLLTRQGHQATSLTGGMNAWVASGLPVVNQRNQPGQVV